MKTFFALLAGLALLAAATAQPVTLPALPPRSPDQLDQLVSPIALYPDPLVAIILPASTAPADVVLAARYVRTAPDSSAIDAQMWDESVKALAHYPEIVTWMDDNLEWTQQLGAAFADQPADTMNSIQRLRIRAREAGILFDTPQQEVVVQDSYIYIEPAQPDVIYVPSYDPTIFYSRSTIRRSPALSFGLAFSTGPWLAFDSDWNRRAIWIDRQRDWGRRRERFSRATSPTITATSDRREWRPHVDPAARQRVATNVTINQQIVQPTPLSAATTAPNRRTSPAASPVPTPPAAPSEPVLTPTGRPSEPRFPRAPRATAAPVPSDATVPRPSETPPAVSAPAPVSTPAITPTPATPATPGQRTLPREPGSRERRELRESTATAPATNPPPTTAPATPPAPSAVAPASPTSPAVVPPQTPPTQAKIPPGQDRRRAETAAPGRGPASAPAAKGKKNDDRKQPGRGNDKDDEERKKRGE
jgi:hypothetical protein